VSDGIADYLPARDHWLRIVLGVLVLAGLYGISRYDFLVFHCLTEAFSIVIAVAVFTIFWNTRRYSENGAFLILGFGGLFAGILDLVYVFAYKGMSAFLGADANVALQAKTAAQWCVSLSCVGAAPFLRRKISEGVVICAYGAFLALALGTIFYWRVFPDCYREGVGQTAFERIGLAISCAAYATALALLLRNRPEFDRRVFALLAGTLIAFFVEDFASALATDINGRAKTIAHLCQVVALYFVYKALVEVGLTKPLDLLFRKQQQTAEALQTIFDSVPAWIFYKDRENRFLRVNRAFAESMGMPREQLEGRSMFDLYPREQAEAYGRDDQQVIASGTPKTNIVEPVRIKNDVRWVQTDKVPYRDPQGAMIGVIGFSVDITERKRAEETLQSSEKRYRLLVETIPQLAWLSSPDGVYVDCNRRWYEYTGQTPEGVRGYGWQAPMHPDDLPRAMEKFLQAANRGEPFEVECRLRRASDGAYRWHLARAVPLLGEENQVTCWIGSATDIEDLKRAQETLERARDEQLEKHRAELAHVARLGMMGEMAASLAHELNQPLHAVNNYAHGCLRRLHKLPRPDEELVAALEQIGEETSRAAQIVRRVRRFVQKREPQFSEVLVNRLVEEVAMLNEAEAHQRHARIVLELSPDLPPVLGDPIQVEQVIMNLVRNGLEAMDQTPQDGRVLSVKTRRHGHDAIEARVRDRGTGIIGEDRERLFQPFFTTKPEGMGMGLAISRSIIQAHGGRLWVSANQDRGCTFHFTLPAGKRD
jgi:PAS domain S-box-containing protein